MNRSFFQYTDAELLALDNETLNDAIRIAAIDKGIQPPIPISEALRRSEFKGYKLPAESVAVFQVCVSDGNYSTPSATKVAYFDEEKAKAALDGLVIVDENRYSKGGPKICSEGQVSIQKFFIGYSSANEKCSKLEEFQQDNTEFDKLSDECVAKLSEVRQADYNRRVNAEKKTEYLRLSGGDEVIAKGFWSKIEKSEWPVI